MPRQARMIVNDEEAVYHVVSRTALEGYVLGDEEKEYLLNLVKHLSSIYFTEVLGFCFMGNHIHLVVKMRAESEYSDEEIRERFELYYRGDKKKILLKNQMMAFRKKWENLSEYVKEIKQSFSRFYNKRHKRKGFFWSDRFKSVLVEEGDTLINLLAYVDLNPVRAGLVEKPEDYRWSSLGYHLQTNNKGDFLSLDFGLAGVRKSSKTLLEDYRKFVYEKGSLASGKGVSLSGKIIENEDRKGFKASQYDRFLLRTRYFTDSGIIGSKAFIGRFWSLFKDEDDSRVKKPVSVIGIQGLYSLKRLSEML